MTTSTPVGPPPTGGGPTVSQHPARNSPRRPPIPRTYITAREIAVLRLTANGNTNKSAGRALGIGTEAVNSRMQSLMRKLRVHDRAQAVAVGLRLGLLSMDEVVVPEGANQGYGYSR
ncbi:response regulator transcription factor [Streptomyces sp. NPDC056652]|uniref:response regulator transcription factor n=1 Tax=Streptomyces sp. NPDC056652 TaxID=3345893 RepID=UPI00367E6239